MQALVESPDLPNIPITEPLTNLMTNMTPWPGSSSGERVARAPKRIDLYDQGIYGSVEKDERMRDA